MNDKDKLTYEALKKLYFDYLEKVPLSERIEWKPPNIYEMYMRHRNDALIKRDDK